MSALPHDKAEINTKAIKNAIVARLEKEHQDPLEPGKMGAINFGGLVKKVDALLKKHKELIKTLTPDQYDFAVDIFIALLDKVDGKVNPEPEPA